MVADLLLSLCWKPCDAIKPKNFFVFGVQNVRCLSITRTFCFKLRLIGHARNQISDEG